MTSPSLHNPVRGPDESFEAYRARRKASNAFTGRYHHASFRTWQGLGLPRKGKAASKGKRKTKIVRVRSE